MASEKERSGQCGIPPARLNGGRRAGAPIRAVIFDMDNTLFDFVHAQIGACSAVVRHLGRGSGHGLYEYFRRPGKGFEDPENIRDYMLDIGLEPDGQFSHCCRIYEEVKLSGIAPYPGVPETLEHLAQLDLSLSVVTDAVQENALHRLERAGIRDRFDLIVTPDRSGRRKPDPESFLFALRGMGAAPEETLVVGDSMRRDIRPGGRLGMVTAYAAYGDRSFSEAESCAADFILRSPAELCRIVRARD